MSPRRLVLGKPNRRRMRRSRRKALRTDVLTKVTARSNRIHDRALASSYPSWYFEAKDTSKVLVRESIRLL